MMTQIYWVTPDFGICYESCYGRYDEYVQPGMQSWSKVKERSYGIHYLRMPKEISLPHEYAKKV